MERAEGPTLAGEDLSKAAGAQRDEQAAGLPTERDDEIPSAKAMFWDPFAVIEQLGYKERPTAITYGTLRSVVYKMPVIQAVIQTRVNQVASFAHPQTDRYDIGFRVTMRDDKAKAKGPEKKWIGDMQDLMMHTGVWGDPRDRDGFETFLRKLTWDSLTYDQACFEIVPNRKKAPAQWVAVDASSFRLADTATAYMKKRKIRDDTMYVQIYDGMVVNEYTKDELCFGVRNPRTDMRLYGYGTSELEMLMSTITSLLWAWQYNQRFFSQGSATKGILNFKGAIPERQLKGFRRHWYNLLTSVENAWRTPITNAEGLEWIDLHANNRDMEFNAWMDFLIKVACFTPETKTQMADGSSRRMDEVKPGDMVMTHMGRAREVKNVQVTEHDGKLVCLKVGGEVIKATPEHPFYAASSRINSWMRRDFEDPRWVKAKDLVTAEDYLAIPKPQLPTHQTGEKGDRLRERLASSHEKSGQGTGTKSHVYETPAYFFIPIAEMWREQYVGKVYNMEVEGDHTYTVHGVAVHNCSMYSMDPVEVNFKYGNVGQKSAMQDSHNSDKITESKERGLRPLLRSIEAMINRHIIWPSDENFKFEFVGLDSKTTDEVADLHAKQVKTTRTVDELRAEDDLPPLKDGMGDVLLDPTWAQIYNQKQMAAMGAEPGAEGPPGAGGDGPPGAKDEKDEEGGEDFDFEALLSEEEGEDKDEGTAKSLYDSFDRRHDRTNNRNVSIRVEL